MSLGKLTELEWMAVLAATYLMKYDDSEEPDGGFSLSYSKRGTLEQIRKESRVDLNIDKILKEWEDEEYQSERLKHKCPVCQKLMVKRKNKKTNCEFWGCEDFREAKHRQNEQNRKEKKYNQRVDDDRNYWDAMDSYFSMDYDNGW